MNSAKGYMITFNEKDSDQALRYYAKTATSPDTALTDFHTELMGDEYILCITASNRPAFYKPAGKLLYVTAIQEVREPEQKTE